MKILVTGAGGQLGNELKSCLESMCAEIGPIDEAYSGAQVDYVDYDELDITDYASVTTWFSSHGAYDLVINCAAFTNVDGCENNEAAALRVNAIGAENLAQVAEKDGAKLVHVSTDYVFAGDLADPRNEEDAIKPISAYGRTKWASEVLAQAACSRCFVVRTAWLYGYVGKNFPKTMIALARKNGGVSVVADQLGNPTSANDLAYQILEIALTESYGVFHCTNSGTCSWFDFASKTLDFIGIECPREPLTSAEYKERFPNSADRPQYSSLENKHLKDVGIYKMRPWEDALETYIANLNKRELSNGN